MHPSGVSVDVSTSSLVSVDTSTFFFVSVDASLKDLKGEVKIKCILLFYVLFT